MIKTQEGRRRKTFLTKYLPLTLLQGFERVVQGLRVRGSWRSNITAIFWPQTYGRQRYVFLVLRCSTGGPEATLLGDGFLYGILSASSPDLNSSGPKSPFGLMWLSLPHLVSNSVRSSTQLARRTQLSYIIVQRPLDLWNRMFNRHQAEITVMQFRGHSLPVHHSVSGTAGPSPCPILSALIRPRDLFRLLAIGMCHFLPVHHLGIAFWAGSKVKTLQLSLYCLSLLLIYGTKKVL